MATPDNPSNYQYKKLQDGHIRLLKLRPGPRSGAPAIAEIFSCLLEESPEYDALSYVWDKPLCIRTIVFGKAGQIRVSANVFMALKWLQQQTSERLMWIDAICINQGQGEEATKEREAQVKMMGKIYAKAKTVIMHFGPSAARYNGETIERLMSWLHSQNNELLHDVRTYAATQRLAEEEYFKRTWTIQEVILAKEVFILFRDSLLPWPLMLSKILKLHFELHITRDHPLAHIPIVQVQNLLGNDRSPGLSDVLRATEASKATDPRDKIYALLGLIKEDPEHYPIKYDPWTAAMVFAHYTFRFCEERNSLDALEKSRHIAPRSIELPCIEGLPSWANDFTDTQKQRRHNAINKGWYSHSSEWSKTRFCAHYHLPLSIKFELGQDLALDSQGRKVGEIRYISQSKFGRYGSSTYELELLWRHLDDLTDPARPFVEWSSLSDFLVAFFCTHICGPGDSESQMEELVREEVKDISVENGKDWKRLVRRLINYFTEPESIFIRMAGQMPGCCTGNSLFTTDNPFMGLGSGLALPGDIVCVLNGGRTPFILRRTNTIKDEYQLVCECYMYGIMQGEWMRDVKKEDLEWFRLV